MRGFFPYLFALILSIGLAAPAPAQQNAFDLDGPAFIATVTRGEETLPIGKVPALRAGDRISVKADLPPEQSARYRLVLAFLRGPTNPPIKDWFFEAETWEKKAKDNSIQATVPDGAEQAVILFAPETAGSYDAVRDAVRGRPGVFVRAAQDLYQASLDRLRLEAFVSGIARTERDSPDRLATLSPVLAESYGIKLNTDCLRRQRALQAACLTQRRDDMVLQIGRGTSLTETLTGAPVDVAYRIAAVPEAGAGNLSPYIGLARDVARLFGAFRSAQYQYVPALALGTDERLHLSLNTAPSFQNPRSVLVAPLPPIGESAPPVWRATAKGGRCVAQPGMAVPLENAQLLFASGYARDLRLRVATEGGRVLTVPVTADAERGGIVLTGRADGLADARVTGATLEGKWGFAPFNGPTLPVQTAPPAAWAPQPDGEVIVGRDHPLTLKGGASPCVEQVTLRVGEGQAVPLQWKPIGPNEIQVTLPLTRTRPSDLSLMVAQYGAGAATIPLVARAEPSRLERFVVHSGDGQGVLTGARLDQVASLTVGDQRFVPGELARTPEGDRLTMTTEQPVSTAPGSVQAKAALKDGRIASVATTVAAARPAFAIVNRRVDAPPARGLSIALPETVVPVDATLVFSTKRAGGEFALDDVFEIAAANGSGTARLTIESGAVQRVGGDVAVATVQPRELLGSAVSGPLRIRLLRGGAASDWQPLADVVRLPELDAVTCGEQANGCTLTGRSLFVLAGVGVTNDPKAAQPVPDGFVGTSLSVPKPVDGGLYLRLHDAPGTMIRVALPTAG